MWDQITSWDITAGACGCACVTSHNMALDIYELHAFSGILFPHKYAFFSLKICILIAHSTVYSNNHRINEITNIFWKRLYDRDYLNNMLITNCDSLFNVFLKIMLERWDYWFEDYSSFLLILKRWISRNLTKNFSCTIKKFIFFHWRGYACSYI